MANPGIMFGLIETHELLMKHRALIDDTKRDEEQMTRVDNSWAKWRYQLVYSFKVGGHDFDWIAVSYGKESDTNV